MEAKALSPTNTLKSWNLFELETTGDKHLIGYSPEYGFDVITPEISFYEYDKKSKTGKAMTRTGTVFLLDGRPQRINPKGHMLLREFMENHSSDIRFIS